RVHLATRDAEAAVARVRKAGGRVLREPERGPGTAVRALAADPAGAVFGLWRPGERTDFAAARKPGAYLWTDLLTRAESAAAVDAFYAEVFGYVTHAADFGAGSPAEGEDFSVWCPAPTGEGDGGRAGAPIGGRGLLGAAHPPGTPPHFLPYFAVADCDGAVAAA
ncbi:VOC family protein, partial [Streptomyces boncukensis]